MPETALVTPRSMSQHLPVKWNTAGGIAMLLALEACAPVGPDYASPEIPVPDYWNTSVRADFSSRSPEIEGWWRYFNDPTLNKLIAIAETQNRDLAITAERIEEARALSGIARGGLSPYVAAGGSINRSRSSESLPYVSPNPSNFFGAGFDAGWELDFVGGLRRAVEASQANLAATEEFHRDAMVIIYSEIAASYVDYRTLQRRITLARSNIKSQKQSVGLTRGRKEAGLAPQIDVSQAESNLATSEALIPQLQIQLAATRNRIAALVGRYPGAVGPLLGSSDTIPSPSRKISVGLPANLIRARPDIRAAERELAAQTARIGVATAELYPKFTLVGTFALQSGSSGDFFDSDSRAYGFGPGFQWRLFEGGAIRESIKVEESRTRQALYNYEQTILEAVSEVETALSSISYEKRRQGHLAKAVSSSRETVSLIKDNYTEGLVDFQNVLDAERTIFADEDAAAASAGLIARNHIALYRALGGGTRMPDPKINDDKS